jgi:DNA-binding GntR family transcriptional regulator
MKAPLSETKTDAAYREIRIAIETGEYAEGDRLAAAELQGLLGMSPTPIREALRLLQRDGLVTHMPHRGMVVSKLDEATIMENSRIREHLEPLATELAAERASDEELAHIAQLHERLAAAVERDPAGPDVPRLNSEWHIAIYRASHLDMLVEFIDRLWSAMGITRYFSAHGEQAVAGHSAITNALLSRDAVAASDLMLQHIREVKSDPRHAAR